jgi:hypothetical protein
MYAGYFTVNDSVGGRFAGVAAAVVDGEDDGDAAGAELLGAAAALLDDVDGVELAVGWPAVWTSSSPPVNRSAA